MFKQAGVENLLIKLKPEIKENVFSENNKLSRENNIDQYVQSAKKMNRPFSII